MQTLSDLRAQVEQLKARGSRPRVHGNGFIQLDLDERRRLHVFGDPDIPKQRIATPIHNHSFSFVSTIYKGVLTNIDIDFCKGAFLNDHADHAAYVARIREGEDTILEPTGDIGMVAVLEAVSYGPGENYSFRKNAFHMTLEHGPTITVIKKDAPTLAQGGAPPLVLVPIGLKPDNDFNRYLTPPEMLWEIILRNL